MWRRWPLLLVAAVAAAGGCPPPCECKWRSGKEAAWCRNVSAVPTGLDAGTQLLDLAGNPLAPLPPRAFVARGLAHLQRLNVARCGLRHLAADALAGLANLVELDLSGNLLVSVPTAAFAPVRELRELRLSANPVAHLEEGAFRVLPGLVRLEMSNCRISLIAPLAFAGIEHSLEWLRLDGNELTGVAGGGGGGGGGDVSAVTTLSSLHGLALAGNPWNCSCGLRPLRRWLAERRVPLGDEPPTCEAPARLRGRAWDRLAADDFACPPTAAASAASERVEATEGDAARLQCPVSADPPPTVKWLWRGRPLVNRSSPGRYVVNSTGGALTVLRAEPSDSGPYQCVGENRAGRASAAVTLEVRRRPPPPPPAAALSGRVLAAGVAVAALLVLAAGLLAACALHGTLARKRRRRGHPGQAEGENGLGAVSSGLDGSVALSGGVASYEKIELNHHKPPSPRLVNHREQVGVVETTVSSHPRMREYRGVPDTDDEDDDEDGGYEEDDQDTTTPSADLHIPRINSWDTTPSTTSSSWVAGATQLRSPPTPAGQPPAQHPAGPLSPPPQPTSSAPLPPPSPAPAHGPTPAQLSASNLTAHVMRRRDLGPGCGSLYTSAATDYPDLLAGGQWASTSGVSSTLPRRGRYGGGGGVGGGAASGGGTVGGGDSSQSPLLGASQLSLLQRQPPPSPPCPVRGAADLASYDYHAQQLERFLMEYRSLQRQLSRMKMAVDRRRGVSGAGSAGGGSGAAGAVSSPPSAGEVSPPPYWLGGGGNKTGGGAPPLNRRFSGGDFFNS